MPSPTYIYTRLACACQDAPGTPSVSRGSSRGGAGGDPSHQASRPSVRGSTVEALQFTCEPGLAVPRCQRAEFGRERLARRRHGRILTRRRGHKCRREQLLGGGAPDERELGFDLIWEHQMNVSSALTSLVHCLEVALRHAISHTQMRHQWQSPWGRDHAHPSRSDVAAARAARPTGAPRAPDEGGNQRASSEVIIRGHHQRSSTEHREHLMREAISGAMRAHQQCSAVISPPGALRDRREITFSRTPPTGST